MLDRPAALALVHEFTESDVRKIFVALQKGLESAKARFSKEGDGVGGDFRL